MVAEVVGALPGSLGQSTTLVTRAIASSPSLKAAYRDAESDGDELFARALAAVAAGTIGGVINGEASALSAPGLAVPLVSAAEQPDGEWSRTVLETMKRLGLLGA